MRQALVVAGMHRSGTSCLTRVLSLCGCSLPKHIDHGSGSPADASARDGFWESKQVLELHEALLASAGSAWDDFREFPAWWFASHYRSAFERAAVRCLRMEYGDSPLFVLKDPRLCRLVPFWLAVFREIGVKPFFVLTVRHPSEVVASLRTRNGMTPAHGKLFWLSHMLAAERDTRGEKRAVHLYRDLLAAWREVVQKVFTEAELDLPDLRPGSAVASLIEAYLDPRLRHHIAKDDRGETAADDELARALALTWECMAASATTGSFNPAILDGVAGWFRAAEGAFLPLLADPSRVSWQMKMD